MRIIRALADESVMVLGVVSAFCVAAGFKEDTTAVAVAIVPLILAVLVRMATSSPSTVAKVAYDTAESLSGPSAGAVGTVTKRGTEIIDSVVSGVGGLVGALAPKAKEAE